MDMLCISDLYKRFSDKKVLNGLNLSVPEHSIFGFIGKNGAGKTTTMKMVLGLLSARRTGVLSVYDGGRISSLLRRNYRNEANGE